MNFNFDYDSLGFVSGPIGLSIILQITIIFVTFFYTWKNKWKLNSVNLISLVSVLLLIIITIFYWSSHEIDTIKSLIFLGVEKIISENLLKGHILINAFFTYELLIALFDFTLICILIVINKKNLLYKTDGANSKSENKE